MKTEQPLAVTGSSSFSVTITDDAQKRKSDALALAADIKMVTTIAQQQDAIAAASILKGLVGAMEKTRVEVKKPVLEAGREIDDVAKIYSGTLDKELRRIEGLAADFQREENRKADALRQEQERIASVAAEAAEKERQHELAKAREAEAEANRARLRDLEAIQAAADEVAREAAQKAADEAAIVRAEQARLAQVAATEADGRRAEEARKRQEQMAVVAQQPKAAGASVRVSMDFEVLNIAALYVARPDLVELKERRAQILAAINIPNAPSIHGIRVFESTKLSAKATL